MGGVLGRHDGHVADVQAGLRRQLVQVCGVGGGQNVRRIVLGQEHVADEFGHEAEHQAGGVAPAGAKGSREEGVVEGAAAVKVHSGGGEPACEGCLVGLQVAGSARGAIGEEGAGPRAGASDGAERDGP